MSNSNDDPDSPMDDIKRSLKLLTQLAIRADERMDALEDAQTNSERRIAALADGQLRMEEVQANSERKIAALADAQIRTEDALTRLSEAQLRTEENIAKLAVAQSHTNQRLDALIDIVRERLGGQPQG